MREKIRTLEYQSKKPITRISFQKKPNKQIRIANKMILYNIPKLKGMDTQAKGPREWRAHRRKTDSIILTFQNAWGKQEDATDFQEKLVTIKR